MTKEINPLQIHDNRIIKETLIEVEKIMKDIDNKRFESYVRRWMDLEKKIKYLKEKQ